MNPAFELSKRNLQIIKEKSIIRKAILAKSVRHKTTINF